MTRVRRVNLYGGPCCGKSRTAPKLVAALQDRGYLAEAVHEAVKYDAFNGRPIRGAYQIMRFGEQCDLEDNRLKGANVIVTDSPLYLQAYYACSRGETFFRELCGLCEWMEKEYHSLNIFLDRDGIKYSPHGRYQTAEKALAVDQQMLTFLRQEGIPFVSIKTLNFDEIVGAVVGALGVPYPLVKTPQG